MVSGDSVSIQIKHMNIEVECRTAGCHNGDIADDIHGQIDFIGGFPGQLPSVTVDIS